MPDERRPVAEHLKIPEVAQLLGLSEKTIRRRVKSGEMPSVLVGGTYLISKTDLAEYLRHARVRPGKASASLSKALQESLFDGDAEREAFLRRVEEHVQARVACYAQRLAEAEQGDVTPLVGYEGAALLADDAWQEFTDLADLINGELAERWATDPEVPEEVKVALARAVGQILETFLEIVRRIAEWEWELAETAAQEERAERRREEIRERTERLSA